MLNKIYTTQSYLMSRQLGMLETFTKPLVEAKSDTRDEKFTIGKDRSVTSTINPIEYEK